MFEGSEANIYEIDQSIKDRAKIISKKINFYRLNDQHPSCYEPDLPTPLTYPQSTGTPTEKGITEINEDGVFEFRQELIGENPTREVFPAWFDRFVNV
jgi:hypothetical protein